MGKIADYKRQLALLPSNMLNRLPFTLIGAGGIGSPIAFTLAKMGVEQLTIWDHDTIERHNLPNQFYKLSQIGRGKAESLALNIAEYAQIRAIPIGRRYDGSTLNGIVVSAVDSIEARQEIWEGVRKSRPAALYVETRMAGELFQVYPVPLADRERVQDYTQRLYKKVKVYKAVCTAAAIFYTVEACAGLVGEAVKTYLTEPANLPRVITVDLKRWKMMIE